MSENPNPDVATVYDSDWQPAGPVQVPSGKLLPGKTYYWKAYVKDGYNGVSARRRFAVPRCGRSCRTLRRRLRIGRRPHPLMVR